MFKLIYNLIFGKKEEDQIISANIVKNKKDSNYIPIKIIENDNTLRTIIDNYEDREKLAIEDLKSRLGTALPNDVKWSILQDLYLESFMSNHKLFLNTVYQQGLLVHKEKKYQQAIVHYSYGLYYLMYTYPHDLNPTNHIIDYVDKDEELIEMAQHKFINKILRCIESDNISIDEFETFAITHISISQLPLSASKFIQQIKEYIEEIINKPKFNADKAMEDNLNSIDDNFSNEDWFKGYKIIPYFGDYNPIEAFREYGNIYENKADIPIILIPHALILTEYDFNTTTGLPFVIFGQKGNTGNTQSTNINEFLLTIFEYTVGKYSDLPMNERIENINKLTAKNAKFRAIRKKIFEEELPSKVWIIYELMKLDGIGKVTANKLYDNGIRSLNEIMNTPDDILKKVCKKCIKIKNEM